MTHVEEWPSWKISLAFAASIVDLVHGSLRTLNGMEKLRFQAEMYLDSSVRCAMKLRFPQHKMRGDKRF